jgi:hypothetical protein
MESFGVFSFSETRLLWNAETLFSLRDSITTTISGYPIKRETVDFENARIAFDNDTFRLEFQTIQLQLTLQKDHADVTGNTSFHWKIS